MGNWQWTDIVSMRWTNDEKVQFLSMRCVDKGDVGCETAPGEIEPCKPLLEICTPFVYLHNAFRITGLPVDASARDVKRRIDDLKSAEELGDAETEHVHAFSLDPRPTIENIREAAQRLHDPERRLVEEFFWFWPSKWGEGRRDPCLSALARGDKDVAFKTWSSAMHDSEGLASRVAKHNLVVMYQLAALDSEHFALENDLSRDELQTISKYWRTCFRWWEELTDDETFWSLVAARIRMLDDPRLTTGFSMRMRRSLPEGLDKINAMVAIAFFEKGKDDLGRNHIAYVLETPHQGQDNVARILADVTKPLKTRVVNAVKNAQNVAGEDAVRAMQAAHNLLNAVDEPLKIIQMMLPSEDDERADLCDTVAEACLHCAVVYGNKTNEWQPCMSLLETASRVVTSNELKDRIVANLRTMRQNKVFGNLESITSAPDLSTVNGMGFRLYGMNDLDCETKSYLATYYFVIFFLPVLPICRYRVSREGDAYRFWGKVPLRKCDKWHLFVVLGSIASAILYGVFLGVIESDWMRDIRQSNRSPNVATLPARPTTPRLPATAVPTHMAERSEADTAYHQQTLARTALETEIDSGKVRAKDLESTMDSLDSQMKYLKGQLDEYDRQMSLYESIGDTDSYNNLVPTYNSAVEKGRALLARRASVYAEYESVIDEVNRKVELYNSRN